MKLVKFKFSITGLSPLLVSNPAKMKGGQPTMGRKTIPSPEEEAKSSTYQLSDGRFYLPSIQFRMGLLYAVAGKKVGKRSARQIVAASVFNSTDKSILIDPDTNKPLKDYTIDTRRAVVQRQGIMRSRACFEKWATEVEFEIDTDLLSEKVVAENLNEAGILSGCGDYRPSRQGPFGRYQAQLLNGK